MDHPKLACEIDKMFLDVTKEPNSKISISYPTKVLYS